MQNLQLQQAINLSIILILGYSTAHIYLPWYEIAVVIFFAFILEHILLFVKKKFIFSVSYSSMSTAIGVVLMMASTQFWIYLVVISAGLVQKHFLRFSSGHIFNPSNFALMMALLLFYTKAHIVLGQLGDELWLLYLVYCFGMIILYQAGRWIISLVFVLAYLSLQYMFIVLSDPVIVFEDIYNRLYSVSFVVFVLFMLTDPKTTPSGRIAQIYFASAIALCATLLDYLYGFRVHHLFIVLFAICAFYALFVQYAHYTLFSRVTSVLLFILVLGAIIFIQNQAPYYFEMDG